MLLGNQSTNHRYKNYSNVKLKELKYNTHSKENHSITSNKDNTHVIGFYKSNTDQFPEQINNLHEFFFKLPVNVSQTCYRKIYLVVWIKLFKRKI